MAIIFDDQHLRVVWRPGSSPYALATFNHRDVTVKGEEFWADKFCDRHDVEAFGFVSKAPNWFPVESIDNARLVLPDHKPIIGYGHSMGGYACIKHSSRLGFLAAIASGPQVTIDPSRVPDDTRYHQHFDPILNAGMEIIAGDISGRVIVLYDPFQVQDRLHAQWLQGLTPQVEPIRLPFLGHRTVVVLQDKQVLLPLFESLTNGSSITHITKTMQVVRKSNDQYKLYLGRALLAHSRPRTAFSLLASVGKNAAMTLQLEKNLLMSRAAIAFGDRPAAISCAEFLNVTEPGNALYQRQLILAQTA